VFQIFADEDESYRAAKIALCVVIAGLTLWALLGCNQMPDEQVTASAERDAYDKKITYRLPDGRIFEAELPIEYTARVTQCRPEDGCKTRYYQPRQQ
jgi:hypothetical protein